MGKKGGEEGGREGGGHPRRSRRASYEQEEYQLCKGPGSAYTELGSGAYTADP